MKILMVCLGNICRSPMAEGILRHKLREMKREDVETDSAGTIGMHAGEAPDLRMQKTALKNGIDISDLRARQFVQKDFDDFDLIFAMDQSNLKNILTLSRNETDRKKVKLILNESFSGLDLEVPDPYWGNDKDFQDVFDLLNETTDQLIKNYFV